MMYILGDGSTLPIGDLTYHAGGDAEPNGEDQGRINKRRRIKWRRRRGGRTVTKSVKCKVLDQEHGDGASLSQGDGQGQGTGQ